MPLVSVDAKDAMLDALAPGFLSLHSAYSTTGAFEVVGGSPAYVQLAATFDASAFGARALSGGPYTFDIPATEVDWIGVWSTTNTFLGMTPNGGGVLQPFTATGSTLTSVLHGFLVDSAVVVWSGAGTSLLDLTEGVTYWVVAVTQSSLQLSATVGGTAIPFATDQAGFLQGIIPTLSVAQSTFPVTAITFNANMAG